MKIFPFVLLFICAPFMLKAQLGIGFGRQNTRVEVDYAKPQEYIIGGITVSGAQFLDKTSIISISGLKEGDKIKIPSETISNVIKKIWRLGLVGDVSINLVRVEGGRAFLDIHLKERSRLSRFVFVGVPKGQQETLTDKIKLIKGKVITDALIKNTENKLKEHYTEKGFKNAKVRISQRKDTLYAGNNYVYLLIDINKGNRVKINSVEIEGVTAFKLNKVKGKLKKTKEKKWKNIFTPSKFIRNEFEKDKESLMEFYNKNGYRNAKIEFDTVYDHSRERVNVKLKVHEGKKFYYRNIIWTGNYVYSDTILSQILNINKGDVYNPEELQKRLNFSQTQQDITSIYMDDGYLFFNIEPVEIQVDEDSIDIEMRIFEGEQADINKIILKGNTRTSDHVVLRELRTIPGAKFSRSDLIRTQRELSTIGFFDPEKIGMQPVPNMSDGTVDIHYTVEEKPSDQIELSGGWGGAFGFVGTVGVVFNNFAARKLFDLKAWKPLPQGDGQRLALRLQANGKQFQNYSFTFTEPWMGGKQPHSFTFSVNHSINRYINFQTRVVQGSLQITGASLSLGRRLTIPDDWFTMSNAFNYQHYLLDQFNSNFGNINTGTFHNFTFNTTISRNSIDNPTYPRGGSSVTLSVNLTPPYSLITGVARPIENGKTNLVEYHKWMFDNAWYLSIAGNLVLSARTHLGFMGTYNPNAGISPFERFVLGGSGLTINNFLLGTEIIALRGYNDNSIRPLESNENGGLRYNSNGSGGIIYNKYVLELRYPLSLNPSATIFGVAFAEGGNNWGSFKDFNPFDLKRSMGVGARIFMPAFGMLGIDWAYGFDTIPGAGKVNGGQFHFTIGQQIR